MKSVKRLSRYTSILLSLLLMLSAMSPGLTALAQEKANAAPAVLTYEDDSITAELKATEGTSLPAGAALNVKALNKDSQDEAEKALYAQTEAGLNAKASEQGSSIDGFTAYSITLTDKNKRDITPKTGSFTLKITDKNAAAPEAYKQSTDGQKSIALYQAAEAKDEQNNPVSTMEPKQEDAASINTDPDGNVTGVETALTTLKPVAVTWQNPQQQAMEEENAPSVQSEEEQSNALAASYDPNNPGPLTTVETIDSASMGVDIQMFDYERSLPDYTYWGRGQNGMLVQGLVNKELIETEYKDEYYPDAKLNDNRVDLFGNFATKGWKGTTNNKNYLGKANHLFREDVYTGVVPKIGSAGTFYYSSFDNYAYWPKGAEENVVSDEDGTYPFKVYQQIGTPKSGNNLTLFYYQRGNFMPYNPIKDGEFAGNTLNLYDENGKALNPDDARYKEKLYKTQEPAWSRHNPLLEDGQITENNYYFGMVVTANFIQQKNGKYNGQDMVYKFNGDDDMWVFIDGVLVLDLGGVRDAQSGEINFSTGEVKWTNYNKQHVNAGNLGEGCKDFTKTIKDQFKDTSKKNITEWNNNGEGDTFADYTGHEIKIFYMERGAGASNCKMQFNLPTVPKDSISVTKEVTNVNEGAYTNVDFAFKLYLEAEEQSVEPDGQTVITDNNDTKYVLATNEPYTLKDGSDETPGKSTNEDGTFILKHGQTAYFNGADGNGIATAGKKYIIQEVGVNQNEYDSFKVTANATDQTGVKVDTQTDKDGKWIVQTSPLTVGTNSIVKMQNTCKSENLHAINITKEIANGGTSEEEFTAQVTIGGKPYTGKYKVAAVGTTDWDKVADEKEAGTNGEIKLKAGQTARIEGIAAGTTFEVTETGYNTETYNAPTYAISESTATAIDTDGKAAGTIQFGQSPQITITNNPINVPTIKHLEATKTAHVTSWDSRTYDIDITARSVVDQQGTTTTSGPVDVMMVLDMSSSMTAPVNEPSSITQYGQNTANNADYVSETVTGGANALDKSKIYYYANKPSAVIKYMDGQWLKYQNSQWKEYTISEGTPTTLYTCDSRLSGLKEAASNFITAMAGNQSSAASKIGIVTFAADNSKKIMDLTEVNASNQIDVLKKVNGIELTGGNTPIDLGLKAGKEQLEQAGDANPKYVLLFSDGAPVGMRLRTNDFVKNNSQQLAADLKAAGYTVITVFAGYQEEGLLNCGEDEDMKTIDWLSQRIASPNMSFVAEDTEGLMNIFKNIQSSITSDTSYHDVEIKDTIDPRFELTENEKQRLQDDGATVSEYNQTNGTTVTWNNQTVTTDGLTKTIHVVAKSDYLGDNNVTTNVGDATVTGGGETVNLPSPTVNVKVTLPTSIDADTIFLGETWKESLTDAAFVDKVKTKLLEGYNFPDSYKIKSEQIQLELPQPPTDENELKAFNTPESDRDYTLTLKYTPNGESSSESLSNTTTVDNVPHQVDSPTSSAINYTVHVVKGQLQITKTIDKQYTDIKQINANQTFVFKIERYEVNKDNNGNESKGNLAETFYETINFNANDANDKDNLTKTKLISGLKKGYYTVTEETSWSPKYSLTKTENNYKVNTNDAVDLFIGQLQSTATATALPQYYGLDNTKDGNTPIYSAYATGDTATTKFTNTLKTKDSWKWLSDTAAAINVFDKESAN